jgi:hypothetical protein
VLERVDLEALTPLARNRILMRRAAVWAGLAYHLARQGQDAQPAAQRALKAIASVRPDDLTESDRRTYAETAMRVGASRWAAVTGSPPKGLSVETNAETGETCVTVANAKRCTFAFVWPASAVMNAEGTALTLAVQPTATWRELWVFRKSSAGWAVRVLPPATSVPEVGYAEFAGWVPGGKQLLAARESAVGGKHSRRFEVLRVDTLAAVRAAAEPAALAAFGQWQDAGWREQTLSLR